MIIEEILNIVYPIIGGFMGIGVIYIILNGALRNVKYQVKAWINLLFGLGLAFIFSIAFFKDYEGDSLKYYLRYFILFGVSMFYAIVFGIRNFRSIQGLFSRSKSTSTHYYKESLFILYRYKTDLFLDLNKDELQGIIIHLKNNDFHDEIINKLNEVNLSNRYQKVDATIKRIGKVTIDKLKHIYHCYVIELTSDFNINGLQRVNAYQVLNQNMNEFNKQIIYRMILRDEFDINLKI